MRHSFFGRIKRISCLVLAMYRRWPRRPECPPAPAALAATDGVNAGPPSCDTLPCPAAVRTPGFRPACLADGRTALSQHRRRKPGRRRASRRSRLLLPVTATAVTAIAGVVFAGALLLRA